MPTNGYGIQSSVMPIAVTGIGFRGPGDAVNVEEFYKLLAEARQSWSPIPQERWNLEAHYHPDNMRNGSSNVKGGHFIKQDLSRFDAPFWNMTPAEAASLDPQQRLLLETCYEALENSGTPLASAVGSNTSTFVGTFGADYPEVLFRDTEVMPIYQVTNAGNSRAIISNRLAYFFDFKGLSVTVDTACSASMTALHLACQSLRTGESQQAIVAGSSVILSPDLFISMSALRLLSPDGRSYSFDKRANGYARGEGVGCVMLKPLDQAITDGDTIRAVIRHTGANQDGKTPGITFPSADAQKALAKLVYKQAGLDPRDTTYVEAHGTGTAAGDPIESSSISEAIAADRQIDRPLLMGSVKSNIGHLEGASGISGLIKSILMLENSVILPNYDFREANERIPLQEWRLDVPTNYAPWDTSSHDQLRRLSINSFGYGGSNAHAILEEADGYLRTHNLRGRTKKTFSLIRSPTALSEDKKGFVNGHSNEYSNGPPSGYHNRHTNCMANGQATNGHTNIKIFRPRIFVLSAADAIAGKAMALALARYVRARIEIADGSFLDDLAYTINFRRSRLGLIAPVFATSAEGLIESLEADALEFSKPGKADVLAFVFTGQGAQWAGMGKELMDAFPAYRRAVERCSNYLRSLGADWDAATELEKDATVSQINTSKLSQPLCTVLQIGLVDLLQQWGIKPSAVTGHSSGEIAAAYATGALSLEDAVTAAYYRGVVSHEMTIQGKVHGGMMAVGLSPAEATSFVDGLVCGKATIACINSPSSITVSGDITAIEELGRVLQEKHVFARKLTVPVAYHSHHMQLVGQEYADAIASIRPRPQTVDFFSSVSGTKAALAETAPRYWVANLLGQVKFDEALRTLCRETANPTKRRRKGAKAIAVDTIVELGPHSALAGPIKQILQADELMKKAEIGYHSVLIRGQDAVSTATALIAKLLRAGYPVDLRELTSSTPDLQQLSVLPDLPPYQWNHSKSYWAEGRLSKAYRYRPFPRHDLLGVQDRNFNPLEPRWRNCLRTSEVPWLNDHKIQSSVVFPAAGYIAIAIEAARQTASSRGSEIASYLLRDIVIRQALVIPEDSGEIEINTSLKPSSDEWNEFFVYSVSMDGDWTEHSRGFICAQPIKAASNEVGNPCRALNAHVHKMDAVKNQCLSRIAVGKFYKSLAELGLEYGPTFSNVASLTAGPSSAAGQVQIADTASTMPLEHQSPMAIHPSTLDACFHPLFAAAAGSGDLKNPMVPISIAEVFVSASIKTEAHTLLDIVCWTTMLDPQHCKAHLSATAQDWPLPEGLVLEVSDLTCVALARAPDHIEASSRAKSAFKMSWKADVDLLQWPEPSTPSAGLMVTTVLQHLSLIMHKLPDARILCQLTMNDQHTSQTIDILTYLGAVDPMGARTQVKMLCEGSGKPAYADAFTPWNNVIEYRDLDGRAQVFQPNSDPTNYDIILDLDLRLSREGEVNRSQNVPLTMLTSRGFYITNAHYGTIAEPDFIVQGCGCFTIIRRPKERVPATHGIQLIGDGLSERDLNNELTIQLSKSYYNIDDSHSANIDPSGKVCIIMSEALNASLFHLDPDTWLCLKRIMLDSAGVIWVTRGATSPNPLANMVSGLLRTVRSENGHFPIVHLDLDGNEIAPCRQAAAAIARIYQSTFLTKSDSPDSLESEYQERSGILLVPRLIEDTETMTALEHLIGQVRPVEMHLQQPGRPLRLELHTSPLADGPCFVHDEEMLEPLADDCVQVEVRASGIKPHGLTPTNTRTSADLAGIEISGVVTAVGQAVKRHRVGDRVSGCHLGPLRTSARPKAMLMTHIPDGMDFETSAALPSSFCMAYYSLYNIAQIRKREIVLIHSAASSVGQAAIQLCQHAGANVLVTVSTLESRGLLMERYGLRPEHIFFSGNGNFAKSVMSATQGNGVDVILNSLRGDSLRLSWSCVASHGRFVDLGQQNSTMDPCLDMAKLAKNVTFTAVDIVDLIQTRPSVVADVWARATDLLRVAAVKPPSPIITYSVSEVPQVLSSVQTAENVASCVAVYRPTDIVMAMPPKGERAVLDPAGSYILVGGLGGIGRALAIWMAEHGAKNLVFINRSGAAKPEARDTLAVLSNKGVNAEVFSCDVCDASNLAHLTRSVHEAHPIKGVVQGSAVFRDVMLEKMSAEDWNVGVKAKVQGSITLHEVLPRDLDFFIMLSSISGVIGNASQANYAAANTFMDAFASHRRSLGLCATSLALGVISGVGHVAEDVELAKSMERHGFEVTSEQDLMALIQCAILGRDNPTGLVVTGLGAYKSGTAIGNVSTSPLFSSYRHLSKVSSVIGNGESDPIKAALASCGSLDEAATSISAALIEKTAELCMLPAEEINSAKALVEYGLDSLIAVEMRTWIFKQLDCTIAILELLANTPIAKLSYKIAEKSRLLERLR